MENCNEKRTHRITAYRIEGELTDKLERIVIAFLNSKYGGIIYFGIDDDGSIIGVENSDDLQHLHINLWKMKMSPMSLMLKFPSDRN